MSHPPPEGTDEKVDKDQIIAMLYKALDEALNREYLFHERIEMLKGRMEDFATKADIEKLEKSIWRWLAALFFTVILKLLVHP